MYISSLVRLPSLEWRSPQTTALYRCHRTTLRLFQLIQLTRAFTQVGVVSGAWSASGARSAAPGRWPQAGRMSLVRRDSVVSNRSTRTRTKHSNRTPARTRTRTRTRTDPTPEPEPEPERRTRGPFTLRRSCLVGRRAPAGTSQPRLAMNLQMSWHESMLEPNLSP